MHFYSVTITTIIFSLSSTNDLTKLIKQYEKMIYVKRSSTNREMEKQQQQLLCQHVRYLSEAYAKLTSFGFAIYNIAQHT